MKESDAGMINRACIGVLYITPLLILMISVSAYAQNEAELSSNGDDYDNHLVPEMELEEELWELDSDLTDLELLWADVDLLCDILLEICLELEVTDEGMYDIFPDLWEPDYEFYLFWEDDWYY